MVTQEYNGTNILRLSQEYMTFYVNGWFCVAGMLQLVQCVILTQTRYDESIERHETLKESQKKKKKNVVVICSFEFLQMDK